MPGMRSVPLARIRELLPNLPTKYAAILAIGVTTGCRISEILALRRFDLIDPEGRLKERISFLRLKSRGGRPVHRILSIPASARPFVARHLADEQKRGHDRPDGFVFRGNSGRPLSRLTVYRFFRSRLGRGFGTHFMRKTFAQEMFRGYLADRPHDQMRALELTRRDLAHAEIDTTVKYLGIQEEEQSQMQSRVFDSVFRFEETQ